MNPLTRLLFGTMVDEPAPPRFADIVAGSTRTDDGDAARREQEQSHAARQVQATHHALCDLVARTAAELRRRSVPTDTGRFTPTGRGWHLPTIDLWIAFDGSAYITEQAKAGAARQFRFDARRQPRTLFELPSWIPAQGGMRHRVVLYGDRLIVSPGAQPFEAVISAAVEDRAREA